jgi:thiol-disulfide isomerase/thioredoxin
MNRLFGLLGMTVVLGVAPSSAQEPVLTPADELRYLVKEYQGLLDDFEAAFREVEGEAQWEAFFAKNYPQPERFYPRFMALAEKHPKDAAAVDALIWVVNHSSPEPKDESAQRTALGILRRDHIASAKMPLVFERADETFLRAALRDSPHRQVRGLACYGLAEQQLSRVRAVTRWRAENPDWQRQWKWLEQTHNAYLVTTDTDQIGKESEKLLGQVVRDFADVPIEGRRSGKTLGELAQGHLYEIRRLAVGQPAPELKSIDLDGNPVRLADLKGRVVVLDVWATWCGPCRAMIPHQRELVKRLHGRPFTLISISVDEKRDTLTEFLNKQPMPWTHWFNGPDGSIIADLNVWSYPRIFVLDAKGVIRYKDLRGKLLDQAVNALLKELEGKSVPK